MITLYFVRHGETEYNRRGIVQGSGIDSDINAHGEAQAQAFFNHYRHLHFDAVYASLLRRTHQTLAPWRSLGHTFHTHAGLNEFSWGIHEGREATPEQRLDFRHLLAEWSRGLNDYRVEGGESPNDAWARARPLFEQIVERHPGQQLLLCSHGRQLRVIISNLLGEDMAHMEQYKHYNTGLSILQMDAIGSARLLVHNDVAHLHAHELAPAEL